jgi:hypothetical protein
MVFLPQQVDVFVNQTFHVPHGVRRNAAIPGQSDRIQPEFAFAVSRANVNVSRLATLVRVEVETKTADAQYRGHGFSVLRASFADKCGPIEMAGRGASGLRRSGFS